MRRGIETRVEKLERGLSTGGTKFERLFRALEPMSPSQLKAAKPWSEQGHGDLGILLDMLKPLDDSEDTRITAEQVIERMGIALHGSPI